MSRLMRQRSSRVRTLLMSSPQTSFVCTCGEMSHRMSSYRGMLVRAHLRACSALEHEPEPSRSGWHSKAHP